MRYYSKNNIIVLLLSLFVIAVLVLSSFSNMWQQQHFGTLKQCEGWSQNTTYSQKAEGALAVQRTFFASELDGSAMLVFVTHNKKVRVFLADEKDGDQLLYAEGFSGRRIVGSESGNMIHVVDLPSVQKERAVIVIQFTPSFDSGNLALNQLVYNAQKKRCSTPIFYAKGTASLFHISAYTIFQIIAIGIICFLGLFCLFCTALLYVKRTIFNTGLFFLGIFAIVLGVNFFFECRIGFLLSPNSFASYFFSTILLAGYPMFFLAYIERTQFLPSNLLHAKLVKTLSFANTLLVCVASFMLVLPFTLVRIYVCFVLVAFTLYLFVLVVYEAVHTKKMVDLSDFMQMLIAVCIVSDFIIALARSCYTDIFFCTRIGMVIFLLYNTAEFINSFFENEILKARSATLKMTLQTDLLTGLKNGARLFEDTTQKYSMVLFSVANIASIIESRGRSEGDNAIRTVANMLKTHFTGDKLYYLFMGKFAVLLKNPGTEDFSGAVDAVLNDIQAYNDLKLGYSIHIVYTSGQFTSGKASDFERLYASLLADICT